jgi:hypothetical protein
MPIQPTNRDLYRGIQALKERHGASTRSLEAFLLALWDLARTLRDRPSLSVDDLLALLEGAWTEPAPPFDHAWRALASDVEERGGFTGWEAVILRQIRDLREMAETSALKNEHRYFGMDAPSGARWYNFDPSSYLEGAAAGTFGGWAPEDGTRVMVPGPVAVLGGDGELTAVDPSNLHDPIQEIPEIAWPALIRFLENGQWYE